MRQPAQSRSLPAAYATANVHALAWLVWAVAAAATIELATNPLYVALTIAVSALVVLAHRREGPLGKSFKLILLIGVVFALVRVALIALTTHGIGATILTLPSFVLPRILGGFRVGGSLEREVLLQAAAEAFVIVGVMSAFGAFNAVVSHDQLVRSAPRAFHELGLVLTVALSFVPSTIATIERVREADRARTGGVVRRRGRVRRSVVPVLETAMEQALNLSESMESRGLAHHPAGAGEQLAGWSSLAALLALGGSFVALVANRSSVAVVLALVGLGSLGAAVGLASGSRTRTRYRATPPTSRDWSIAAVAAAAPLLLAIFHTTGALGSLHWSANPLHAPGFQPLAAACIALLSAPLWLAPA